MKPVIPDLVSEAESVGNPRLDDADAKADAD